jgi:hypothetical protein
MPPRVTARIPVTPDLHSDLNRVKDKTGASDFDALIREMLDEYSPDETGENA